MVARKDTKVRFYSQGVQFLNPNCLAEYEVRIRQYEAGFADKVVGLQC